MFRGRWPTPRKPHFKNAVYCHTNNISLHCQVYTIIYVLMSHLKPVNPVFVATGSLFTYYELWFFSTVLQLALLHLFERLNLHPLHATFLIVTWGLGKALDSLIQHQAFHHADDNFNLSSNAMFICNPLDLPTNQTLPIHGCTRNYNLNQTL